MDFIGVIEKNQKLIICTILCLIISFFVDRALGMGVILILFLTVISLFFIHKIKDQREKRVLTALFFTAFALHILSSIFIYYSHFQPFSGGQGDYILYHQQASEISQRVKQGNFSLQGINVGHAYPVIIGYIYAATLPSMLMGELFNSWLIAISIIFIYLIVMEIGGNEEQGFMAGLIAAIYPSLVFYGSLMLKDGMVVVLSMASILLMVKILKNFSVYKFMHFFAVLTILTHFRFYIGYAVMFGFIACWFFISNLKIKKRVLFGLIMAFLLGFCPMVSGSGYYGFINLTSFLNIKTITLYREVYYAAPAQHPIAIQSGTRNNGAIIQSQDISNPTENISSGKSSSVILKTGFNNPLTFIKNTFLSALNVCLGPFPWQLADGKYLFIFPEMLIWYLVVFFMMRAAKDGIKMRKKIIIPLIFFSAFILGPLSIFMNNFGIITRIRMPAFLALLCIASLGFSFKEGYPSKIRNYLDKNIINKS